MCEITGQPGRRLLHICAACSPAAPQSEIEVLDDFTLNQDGHVGALILRPETVTRTVARIAYRQLHLFDTRVYLHRIRSYAYPE